MGDCAFPEGRRMTGSAFASYRGDGRCGVVGLRRIYVSKGGGSEGETCRSSSNRRPADDGKRSLVRWTLYGDG